MSPAPAELCPWQSHAPGLPAPRHSALQVSEDGGLTHAGCGPLLSCTVVAQPWASTHGEHREQAGGKCPSCQHRSKGGTGAMWHWRGAGPEGGCPWCVCHEDQQGRAELLLLKDSRGGRATCNL